jgi:hypothetical protein
MKVVFNCGATIAALFAAIAGLAWSKTAAATPKPLPFTYGADTNPKGTGEVEQYVDFVPLKAFDVNASPVPYPAMQFQTEFEYGLSNRLELGLYVTIVPTASGFLQDPPPPTLTEGTGIKQRLRWRLADPGDWPVDVALYGEVAETFTEMELEWKLILDRRFGRLRLLANAWFEYEVYYTGRRDWVFNPTAGFTVDATPNVSPGFEYWMRAEVRSDGTDPPNFNAGPHHYVGPTLRVSFGNFFVTSGIYMRLDALGRAVTPSDSYGPVWFRTLVGFGF